jgi:hypothetical protein
MNNFALLRNILWNTCLLTALIILGISSRSACAQSSQALFPSAHPLNLNGYPVFTGDLNGDGKPDLAQIIQGNTQWSLEIQLSFGSNAPATVTTTLCPSGQQPPVSFGDVNNDKKPDLVFWCNGYLTIQLGNGDGSFQTPAYFPITFATPVLVDLNGDGYLDIATFLFNQSTAVPQVAVFLNKDATSPGVFTSPKLYSLPGSAHGLIAGDFN